MKQKIKTILIKKFVKMEEKRYITWYVPVVQYYVHTNCTILMHIYAIAPSVMVCTFYYIFVAYVPAKKLAP